MKKLAVLSFVTMFSLSAFADYVKELSACEYEIKQALSGEPEGNTDQCVDGSVLWIGPTVKTGTIKKLDPAGEKIIVAGDHTAINLEKKPNNFFYVEYDLSSCECHKFVQTGKALIKLTNISTEYHAQTKTNEIVNCSVIEKKVIQDSIRSDEEQFPNCGE